MLKGFYQLLDESNLKKLEVADRVPSKNVQESIPQLFQRLDKITEAAVSILGEEDGKVFNALVANLKGVVKEYPDLEIGIVSQGFRTLAGIFKEASATSVDGKKIREMSYPEFWQNVTDLRGALMHYDIYGLDFASDGGEGIIIKGFSPDQIEGIKKAAMDVYVPAGEIKVGDNEIRLNTLGEAAGSRSKITRGMKRHISRGKNLHSSCNDCGMGIPKYPGKYPTTCPECTGELTAAGVVEEEEFVFEGEIWEAIRTEVKKRNALHRAVGGMESKEESIHHNTKAALSCFTRVVIQDEKNPGFLAEHREYLIETVRRAVEGELCQEGIEAFQRAFLS